MFHVGFLTGLSNMTNTTEAVGSGAITSRLKINHDKLLSDCAAIMDQVCKDSERLRAKLGGVPWEILGPSGNQCLEDARLQLLKAEHTLREAQRLVATERDRAKRS